MLRADYDALTRQDWDNVVCLSADEGVGKSLLTLHALEIWLEFRGINDKKLDYDDAKKILNRFMGIKFIDWCLVLKGLDHADMNIYDEAGDSLTGKHATAKTSRLVEDSYTVIRGLNLMSIFVLPSIFDLAPFFRKRRVRTLWHLSKRGLCHVWHKPKRLKLMQLNEARPIKDYMLEPPLFSFEVPKYEGIFLKPYKEMKDNKMYEVLDDMYKQAKK